MKTAHRFWFIKWELLVLAVMCLAGGAFPVWAATTTASAQAHAEIIPVLELKVSDQATSELKFGNITPSAIQSVMSPVKKINLDIRSNTGEPYIVTQSFSGPMQNTQGSTIDLEKLKFRAIPSGGQGSGVNTFTNSSSAAQTIYRSNETGQSQTVQLEFQLEVPVAQAPGDYSAFLTFTVSTI